MTKAEVKLWVHLSRKKLGVKFRRQCPIGDYIVDFVSLDAGVVIEVDGGQHMESVADKSRDAWLASQGFSVLRFWNGEVLGNIEGVIEAIEEAIQYHPHPTLPHQGGGRRVTPSTRRRSDKTANS